MFHQCIFSQALKFNGSCEVLAAAAAAASATSFTLYRSEMKLTKAKERRTQKHNRRSRARARLLSSILIYLVEFHKIQHKLLIGSHKLHLHHHKMGVHYGKLDSVISHFLRLLLFSESYCVNGRKGCCQTLTSSILQQPIIDLNLQIFMNQLKRWGFQFGLLLLSSTATTPDGWSVYSLLN